MSICGRPERQSTRAEHDRTRSVKQHSRGGNPPELCVVYSPRKAEGAGNAGRWPHPQPCVLKRRSAHKSSGKAETFRHSLRNGFAAYSALSLVSGLFSHHRLPISCVSAVRPKSRIDRLDPSVGGSGPHGLTVRDCTARLAAPPRPSQPASRLVTIG